ncbi:hypothetical protein QI155_03195 [Thermodesulfovibrio sp. 1176]|uniref:hypothetical protein n=1 Tax=Thermodesulfovibrio sp. 1176 TaxID=3043424 RepID=UPI00248298E8|nr:hypothetical protein [Thermodesulfovibrio sp. 1176]MDI1471529.1 hypothetical protein [Thermodesulfovibrio sp. 1176]
MIKVNNFQGLKKYLNAALRRCECSLDDDRKSEIELFLIEKFWLQGKNIPTQAGKKKDVGVKWALRTKLRDIGFKNHTISSICNEDGEEVDIFECIGENEQRYTEIEQWHDICRTVGPEPAKAMLFGLYEEQEEQEKETSEEKEKWESRQGVLF